MKKIVAIGLYVPGTGFTRVLQSIFNHLKSKYDIHWIGIGYSGAILDFGYKIYPNNVNGGDAFGAYFARDLSSKIKADSILVLNDFWVLKNYRSVFDQLKANITKIAYVPLDGEIENADAIKSISIFDKVVLYSKFAYAETKKALRQLRKHSNPFDSPELFIIPHGIDIGSFYPVDHSIAKKICFQNIPYADKCLYILNANRPVERKGLHLTIKAFASLLKQVKEEVYLVLHQAGIQSKESQACCDLIEDLGIGKKVILNPLGSLKYASNADLNILYNACDIGVNSSYGEGWGLISFEHAATGIPQIVPDHTSCSELWKNNALLTKVDRKVKFDTNPFIMSEVNVEHLTENMLDLVQDHELRNRLGQAGLRHTKKKKHQWSVIADQWSKIL
ncbi:glycosyltransferase family 4 protein [Portibacter marinus]|uniref:glycosyltransferase family 4 protein n=1 Tax=Portibacter marinus TaxID=2898660 RepID=UPI001F3B25CE|nr:glycosyltransferase [Portibacter marinus]